jgi:hypothetical protein
VFQPLHGLIAVKEMRISKYRSLLRRVATPQAVQHVNKIIAELERELLTIGK